MHAASTHHFKSTTQGTIDATYKYMLSGVPDATETSVVVNDGPDTAPGPNDYKVVFTFQGGQLAVSSVSKI